MSTRHFWIRLGLAVVAGGATTPSRVGVIGRVNQPAARAVHPIRVTMDI